MVHLCLHNQYHVPDFSTKQTKEYLALIQSKRMIIAQCDPESYSFLPVKVNFLKKKHLVETFRHKASSWPGEKKKLQVVTVHSNVWQLRHGRIYSNLRSIFLTFGYLFRWLQWWVKSPKTHPKLFLKKQLLWWKSVQKIRHTHTHQGGFLLLNHIPQKLEKTRPKRVKGLCD